LNVQNGVKGHEHVSRLANTYLAEDFPDIFARVMQASGRRITKEEVCVDFNFAVKEGPGGVNELEFTLESDDRDMASHRGIAHLIVGCLTTWVPAEIRFVLTYKGGPPIEGRGAGSVPVRQ
jgi:hypothetical protein